MKKTLIALAALAAAGATLAQSSVTIYGRMDLGMSQQDITFTDRGVPLFTDDALSLAGAQDERTGSRLGFRGTEDLGGGLRAGFVYEIGINADRVDSGNAQTRLANLSLSGGFGTVVVGTFMNAFDTARDFSPATGGVPGGDITEFHGGFDSRTQNGIAYVSPTFSGFTFSVGALNEEFNSGASARKHDGMILGLNYSQGPLAAQFAFGNLDVSYREPWYLSPVGVAAPFNAELQNWALGIRYTLPQVVLSFIYEDIEHSDQFFNNVTSFESNAWEIGARFPMGAFAPYITFGDGEIESRNAGGAYTADSRSWQIGATYNLSARTWVYAAVGEVRVSDGNGFRHTRDGYAIGLVHTF